MSLYNLGKQVKIQRNRRGMKQIDLAKDVELTGAHISDVENGMSTPTIQSFGKLCDKLDVSPDVFLVDSNDKFILYAIETYLNRVKETPEAANRLLRLMSEMIGV